jgi:hypothetical protein
VREETEANKKKMGADGVITCFLSSFPCMSSSSMGCMLCLPGILQSAKSMLSMKAE